MLRQINSPFRYAGGKFYARKLIIEHFPKHSCYIEPLAGGASLFFAKAKVEKNWLNDIDEELITCFRIIRDYPEELISRLNGEEATKERHRYYKIEFMPQTDIERALRWFYLNRTSYSGIMNMQNCFWGYGDKYSMRPENWPRNIRQTSEKLSGVQLTSLDFEAVIESAEDGTFLFIDPPYYNTDQDKFYTHTFSRDDHFRLCNVLRRQTNRLKFLLTYDNSLEVRELYSWATEIYEEEWNYTINRTDDQKNGTKRKGSRYKGRELFILNYNSITPQQLNLCEPLSTYELSKNIG
jgi:DNA adenine methylase